jgi:hypothetical protein
MNQATGLFADPAVRRVLWKLVDQESILKAYSLN